MYTEWEFIENVFRNVNNSLIKNQFKYLYFINVSSIARDVMKTIMKSGDARGHRPLVTWESGNSIFRIQLSTNVKNNDHLKIYNTVNI